MSNDATYPLRFSGRNIPVPVAARILGKDAQFVRETIISGTLPIGTAHRKKDSSQYDFYISPKLLYEYSGYYLKEDICPVTN